jgi:sugar lactone lactonase YvrE
MSAHETVFNTDFWRKEMAKNTFSCRAAASACALILGTLLSSHTPAQTLVTLAGNGMRGLGGTFDFDTDAQFSGVTSIVRTPWNGVFVSEFSTNRIRWIGDDGIVTTMVAGGAPGFGGDGGPKENARFSGPNSIILAPDNSLIVFDSGNNRIRRIDATNVYTLYGNGQPNSAGDNGPAANAGLNFPTSGVYGKDGSLYVVEGIGHKVRRITPNGIITTLAGTGVAGYSGDDGAANAAQLNHPRAIAISLDGDVLYVTEQHRVRAINLGNGRIYTFAGNGLQGSTGDGGWSTNASLGGNWTAANGSTQQIGALAGIAVLSDGSVLVSDRANNNIRRIAPGYQMATYAGNGQVGYTSDGAFNGVNSKVGGGALARTSFHQPAALHVDKHDNVYFSDFFNFAVRMLAPGGVEPANTFSSCNSVDPSEVVVGFDVNKLVGCMLRVRSLYPATGPSEVAVNIGSNGYSRLVTTQESGSKSQAQCTGKTVTEQGGGVQFISYFVWYDPHYPYLSGYASCYTHQYRRYPGRPAYFDETNFHVVFLGTTQAQFDAFLQANTKWKISNVVPYR